MILEGEKHVDQARNAVELCDQRENKLKKEIKKSKKCSMEEMQEMEKRLCEAARAKEVAQLEGMLACLMTYWVVMDESKL